MAHLPTPWTKPNPGNHAEHAGQGCCSAATEWQLGAMTPSPRTAQKEKPDLSKNTFSATSSGVTVAHILEKAKINMRLQP